MSTNDQTTLLWVEEKHDRESASDRRSRYGAYLRDRYRLFHEDGTQLLEPDEFAEAAFTIACSPIMSPGYVETHRRVCHVGWCWDADRRPAVELALVVPPPAPLARLLAGRDWQGWKAYGRYSDPSHWVEPAEHTVRAAFTTLTLRIPVVVSALPNATYAGRHADLDTAKEAVAVVCRQVNATAGTVLALLEQEAAR